MSAVPDREQAVGLRGGGNGHVPPRIAAALVQLAEALRCAARRNVWDFAVEVGSLRLSTNELRWLIYNGLVEHAWETTAAGARTRSFRPDMGITLSQRSCFVVTTAGLALVAARPPADISPGLSAKSTSGADPAREGVGPYWDPASRELWLDGVLVKRFRQPAPNQERILSAFEEEGWPRSIDDPLPPSRDESRERRLNHAISRLNGCQRNLLIRFEGSGTGDRVVWRRLPRTTSHCTRRPPK